jgi:2-polyprenyl-3-methyl-5-hydroxy-6-metoxy-1,4-benzoquinol methylase
MISELSMLDPPLGEGRMRAKPGTVSANVLNDSLLPSETVESCPNCGGTDRRFWRKSYDRLYRVSRQEFIYSSCTRCGVVFLSSRPFERDAPKFYPIDYAPYQPAPASAASNDPSGVSETKPTFQSVRKALRKVVEGLNKTTVRFSPDTLGEEIQIFYRPERAGARLLDFGCGTDSFLNQARAQGWETLGMDVSPQAIEQLRRSGHQGFLISPSVWGEIPDESIDLVRMNHVLEHLYNPAATLALVRSKMRPGARLHIALPNPRSVSARLFRSRWFSLECPRHVVLYSPAALEKFVRGAGFSETQLRYETITKDFSRSLGYLLHDFGIIEHKEIMGMMHRPLLAELLYTPARIAACSGAADRFHLFARK